MLRYLLILISFNCFAQYDTIIHTKAYTSYYSKKFQNPISVTYKLYKGGGDCNRASYVFKNDLTLKTLTHGSYANSGYDKGHMANSEDFAYDCELDELTFRYYNCVPQTPELNRGIWKKYENDVRKLSQTDSLIVICYNEFKKELIPTYCYKIVYSLSKKKYILGVKISNTNKPKVETINIDKFFKLTKCPTQ